MYQCLIWPNISDQCYCVRLKPICTSCDVLIRCKASQSLVHKHQKYWSGTQQYVYVQYVCFTEMYILCLQLGKKTLLYAFRTFSLETVYDWMRSECVSWDCIPCQCQSSPVTWPCRTLSLSNLPSPHSILSPPILLFWRLCMRGSGFDRVSQQRTGLFIDLIDRWGGRRVC